VLFIDVNMAWSSALVNAETRFTHMFAENQIKNNNLTYRL